MKTQTSHIPAIRTVLLFLFVLIIVPSCKIFHFDKLNPYNDFTTDQLSNYEIGKIRIIIPDSSNISPGTSFSIGVIAETHFGKEIKTRGLCNGFVNWNSYAVHIDGGTFDKGTVTVFPDPRKVSSTIKITVTPYYYPDLKQEIELPVSYKVKFVANCKGQNGLGGFDGLSGAELHQMDTVNKWHVYNGRKGQNGTDGENGSDGCVADVFVKSMMLSGKQMMNVLVINHCDNNHVVYWIDPDGGSLVVDVSGGDGGNGGNGGNGENGVDGAGADYMKPLGPSPIVIIPDPNPWPYDPGFSPFVSYIDMSYVDLTVDSTRNPTGNGGDGGYGGNGGKAGNGGSGGIAVIHLDSSAVQWENKITVISNGGKSGKVGPGGYAGKGGSAAYNMFDKTNGETGFMGVSGIKGEAGKPGSPAIVRKEKVKMLW